MEGDLLGDILTLASARCVRIGTLRAGGTWALRFPPPQNIKLTAVVKGACWLAVDGEHAPVRLERGDVFVVPAARPFVLASNLKVRPLDGLELFTKAKDNIGTVGDRPVKNGSDSSEGTVVGSTAVGTGQRVQTDTIQKYTGRADHLNIVTPVP
jgi:hypothetical protein